MHIAVDYLLYPVEKHVKWISRPISYIVQYYRIKEVSNLVSRLIRWNVSNYLVYKPLMELNTCLKDVLNDSDVFQHYRIRDKTLEWLDELRDNLRISRKTNLKDSTPGDIDIEEVTRNIKAVLAGICEESRELGGNFTQIASAINNAFESHWEELFVPDPIVNGKKSKPILTAWIAVAVLLACVSCSTAVLPPEDGAISITSEPSCATIGLDTPAGPFVGPSVKTPYTFTKVEPGICTIKLFLDGYQDWSTSVEVRAGETSYVSVTMISTSETYRRK
ncbi:PEGA domain-containing protein [Methanophagales archaeon]|nr:PEGA domain-containing protein [Methanophagales archaeon]